jgi:hypothetical protein
MSIIFFLLPVASSLMLLYVIVKTLTRWEKRVYIECHGCQAQYVTDKSAIMVPISEENSGAARDRDGWRHSEEMK